MSFKDSKGREYDCKVSLATAIELKKIGVDIGHHLDGKLWQQLSEDPALLVTTLAMACADSLKSHGIDEMELASSLDGDSLDAASEALLDAITDFSPPRVRAAIRKVMDKSNQAMNLATDRLNQAVDSLTPEQLLTSFNSSGDRPESSDSSQANSDSST